MSDKDIVGSELDNVVELFQALGNRQRLNVIKLLLESDRPIHVKGISRQLKLDYASTYRHIERLKSAGVLGIHEVGRSRVPFIRHRDKLELILKEASMVCMSEKT